MKWITRLLVKVLQPFSGICAVPLMRITDNEYILGEGRHAKKIVISPGMRIDARLPKYDDKPLDADLFYLYVEDKPVGKMFYCKGMWFREVEFKSYCQEEIYTIVQKARNKEIAIRELLKEWMLRAI